MSAPLIGLIGVARAGKDTFAQRLVEEHGWVRLAFADLLKEAALKADPIITYTGGSFAPGGDRPRHFRLSEWVGCFGWEEAKGQPEVRRFLQNFGQGVRAIDPDVWVRPVIEKAVAPNGRDKWGKPIGPVPPVAITDVRYANEAKAIEAQYGTLVRIIRPGAGLQGENAAHDSETELADYPTGFTAYNDGDFAHINGQADELARYMNAHKELSNA